jgi:hypothetical protein
VAAAAERSVRVKGGIDHFGALNCLQGLPTVLCGSGDAGLIIVLDEGDTTQRVRGKVRNKSLIALRKLIDDGLPAAMTYRYEPCELREVPAGG